MVKLKILAGALILFFGYLFFYDQKADSKEKAIPSSKGVIKLEGLSDASCVVTLDQDIVAVGEDENNKISIYHLNKSLKPLYSYSLKENISAAFPKKEIDLEAVTRIDQLTFWLGSHSRDSKGELKEKRHYLFALKFSNEEKKYKPELVGKPYRNLVSDLVSDKRFKKLDLEDLSRKNDKRRAAKTKTGFNIEGLSYWYDHDTQQKKLLVGLRSPIHKKKAIAIPIENPYGVIYGDAPIYGEPLFWNLKSRGIRSMEYDSIRDLYFIVAGDCGTTNNFALYSWSGKSKEKPSLIKNIDLKDLNVEGLTIFLDKSILLISDDGSTIVKGKKQKDLAKEGKEVFFRAIKISI